MRRLGGITNSMGMSLSKLLKMVKDSLPEWMSREAENENAEETGACRDYDDFFNRTRVE